MKTKSFLHAITQNLKWIIMAVLLLSIFTECNKESDNNKNGYTYSPPLKFEDGLEVARLDNVGLETGPIIDMMNYLNSSSGHTIHNILIIKDNKLVFEEYFKGYALAFSAPGYNGAMMEYTKSTDHYMASVSKSVTSVILGIAVKDGYLPDLNKKIVDYLPEYANVLTGEKANITIHHLLTMTSGLAFDESTYPYGDSRNEVTQMLSLDDPIGFILSKQLTTTPGTQFHYSSGSGIILAAIIEKVTGMKFLDYANANLFDPLRSEGGAWSAMHSGLMFASGGLYFKARELSKIGLLFLNGGQWEGQQIITEDWINTSQAAHVATTANFFPNTSYGYQWWITNLTIKGASHKCFFAAGWGDQYMFIIPDLEMIIEFNGGNYAGTSRISPFNLVNNYILRAVK